MIKLNLSLKNTLAKKTIRTSTYILLFIHIYAFSLEKKIISLAPHFTEIIYALDAQKNLVGRTDQCDYPNEASQIESIGSYINPKVEKILKIKPDIIFATMGTPLLTIEKLKSRGFNVHTNNPTSIDELTSHIIDIGRILNRSDKANKLVSEIKKQSNFSEKIKGRFVFIIESSPLYSISKSTWISQMIEKTGLKNSVESKILYPTLQREIFLKEKPQYIFFSSGKNKTYKIHLQPKTHFLYKELKLKSNTKIFDVPSDIFFRPGPRVELGLKALKELQL